MRVRKAAPSLTILAVGTLAAAPALAHHSLAMFDNQKNTTLEGTVKAFQWINPHSWVVLLVRNPVTRRDEEWSIEGASPNVLARRGWTRASLKAGDKATVVIHPLKDGSNGGSLVSASVKGVAIAGGRA